MKKFGFVHRTLVILLVMIMVVQAVPAGVWAIAVNDIASGNYVGDPGVDTDKLSAEGSIRWPVRIYDYLNDGMLFEYANATHKSPDNSLYGGGELAPNIILGTDYTADAAYSEQAFKNHSVHSRGTWYKMEQTEAVPFVSPQYLRMTAGTGSNSNVEVSSFAEDNKAYYSPARIRYMTVVYRSSGTEDDLFRVLLMNSYGTYRYGRDTTLKNSGDWTYVVLDLQAEVSDYDSFGNIAGVWLACEIDKGSSDYFDFSHVAYFNTAAEAENFGKKAVAFDKNPGEHLEDATTIIHQGTVMPEKPEPEAILSLRYRYKTENDSTSTNYIDKVGNYGLDLTHSSTAEGHYTNGYASDTYWTWANGTTLSLRYGSNYRSQTMTPMKVTKMTEKGGQSYVRLTNGSGNTGYSQILLSKFREGTSDNSAGEEAPLTSSVNYAVLVYRGNNLSGSRYAFWAAGYQNGTSNYKYAGVVDTGSWYSSPYTNSLPFEASNGGWTYVVVPLDDTIYGDSSGGDEDMQYITRLRRLGLYLPALTGGKSLDLAYVAYFDTNKKATDFGVSAAGYMNSGVTVGGSSTYVDERTWNMGNNQAFAMLYASCGGGWASSAGGSNANPNGYYSWMIGYHTGALSNAASNANRQDINGNKYTAKYTTTSTTTTQQNVTGSTNNIYFLSAGYSSSPSDGNDKAGYQTNVLDFDGYDLLQTVTKGIMTAGLLEGSLSEDRMPVYRQDTVEYIAYTLYHSLVIPQKDSQGNYNYNFVKGSPSTQFGGYDLNGDGSISKVDLNGDGYMETDEASVDLATALRACLGIRFVSGQNKGTYPAMGSYAESKAKGSKLIGAFKDCRDEIETAMDAAYYLLNNVFNANSYNQLQNDYSYLTLSSIPTSTGGTAYVFDAGFSTGEKGTETTDGYANKSQSAVVFKPYVSYDENGDPVHGDGTISLENVNSKDMFWYEWNSTYEYGNTTTRFPFLPVTDAEGDYKSNGGNAVSGSTSPYFNDDGVRSSTEEYGTYVTRNYNYVLVSNGEFVYRAEDDLFFQFEGDDDVYLFINGELVLDIGGAHSITSGDIQVDDYVAAARKALAPLEQYGYFSSMTASEFEELLEKLPADTDEETLDAYRRWFKLDLVDGEICTFDFYYMERHGYGANMRIYTNMHITDPKLGVEKKAYQYKEEVEYGGVVDPSASIEYNFKTTNNGNTKLYNLTFWDETIGVKLTPENGLEADPDLNGTYLVDAFGGKLDASDLSAHVEGYDRNGEFSSVDVTFKDNEELKSFLNRLQGEGLENDYDDAEITNAGSGLWVGASVTIKGMYYFLTPEQVEVGMLNNTVYVTGTTRVDPNDLASQIRRSEASHRVYTSGAPVYYQWAGHDLFMREQKLLDDATQAAGLSNSQLSLYEQFFNTVANDTSKIYTRQCDKFGNTRNYPELTSFTDAGNNWGFLINYPEGGVKTFYILMFLAEGKNGAGVGYPSGASITSMKEGEFAIIRVTVYVAEVNDSTYVLDFGLKTESLDEGGELFKNDYLFGNIGSVKTKLMGVTNIEPKYLSPRNATKVTNAGTTGDAKNKTASYNRIDFDALNLSGSKKVLANAADKKAAGFFTVNLAIPKTGKLVTYDINTGKYSLTAAGTVTVNAEVPLNWENVYLYYWYDGSDGNWPGIPMNYISAGKFYLDIPGDVSHVIINNGDLQTKDLNLTAGVESTVKVTVDNQNNVSATIESVVEFTKVHVSVPEGWGSPYLYYWDDNDQSDVAWPGVALEETDEEGYFVADIPGTASQVVINNGDGMGKQTPDLDINAGQEVWLEVGDTPAYSNSEGTTDFYNAEIIYTRETALIHAKVPAGWGETINIYYWREGSSTVPVQWPGNEMTLNEEGWYTLSIPADITRVIINDGSNQTVNLSVNAGAEAWITVGNLKDNQGHNTAEISYGADGENAGVTFTPTDFMNGEYSVWLSLVSHTTGFNPTAMGQALDINNEVQMFKKVTVLPATVVYYEDDFAGVRYNTDSENTFTSFGKGSGSLVQSVDQNTIYGQDATYQSNTNSAFSGGHMYDVKIMDNSPIMTFDFTGTGFEIIGSTAAMNAATLVVGVYKPSEYATYATAAPRKAAAFDAKIVEYLALKSEGKALQESSQSAMAEYQGMKNRYDAYMKWYDEYKLNADLNELDGLETPVVPQAPPASTQVAVPTAPSLNQAYSDYITAYDNYLNAYSSYLDDYESCMSGCQGYFEDYGDYLDSYNAYIGAFEAYQAAKKAYDAHVDNLLQGGTALSTDYYLFGYINGGNYACEENWTDMGQYKFVNGKLIATFEQASYVAVKDSSNSNWYMTDGWLGEKTTTAQLYNSGTLGDRADKLYVPAGVSLLMTLTENDDGTLTLDYTVLRQTVTAELPAAPVMPEAVNAPVRATAFSKPNPIRLVPVITQFDNAANNGKNEGSETIYQVPMLRIKDLTVEDLPVGEYTVELSGAPSYDFDAWGQTGYDPDELEQFIQPSFFSLDGIRVFRPLGPTHEAYAPTENGATFTEIRDLIMKGKIAVAGFDTNGLKVSTGSVTWTEDLLKDPVTETFLGNKVSDSGDYLLKGPNNEVYMLGGTTNAAMVFYVQETAGDVHSLQIAIRTLDYGRFMGGASTGLNAQLQYGVLTEDGYAWKPLTTVVSGTEEYYAIPYTDCPVVNGNYQVVLRVVNPSTSAVPMVSYTSVKTLGLNILTVEGNGETSNMYYQNGILVSPEFYLSGVINGKSYGAPHADDPDGTEYLEFENNRLTVKITQDSSFVLSMVLGSETVTFAPNGNVTEGSAAKLYRDPALGTGMITVKAGNLLTFTLDEDGSVVNLTWQKTDCNHSWNAGQVTKPATCTAEGEILYTCTLCGETYTDVLPVTEHNYQGDTCKDCGAQNPNRRIYVIAGWTDVYVYTWTGDTKYTGGWPGTKMEPVDGENGMFCFDVPRDAVNIIFNNGAGSQTADLTVPTGGNDLYDTNAQHWTTYSGMQCDHEWQTSGVCGKCGTECDHDWNVNVCKTCGKTRELYLAGYINGRDYGIGGDYSNVGQYKFVDGQLTVTFSQDSYVVIKTADLNLYMTESFVSVTEGVFCSWGGEKMFVPGNVEVTFSYTVNDDGTVTLRYTAVNAVMNIMEVRNQMAATAVIVTEDAPADTLTKPVISLQHASLTFDDAVRYNVYFQATGLADVVEMGLITFDSKLTDGTVADANEVIPGYEAAGGMYRMQTGGIAAKDMADKLYFKVYAKLSDGSYVYSKIAYYNAVMYAEHILEGNYPAKSKALAVALLNYGTAAQKHFGTNAGYMNEGLTQEQKALVMDYDASMMDAVVKADAAKAGTFAATEGFGRCDPSITFEGAFAINYYVRPGSAVDGEMTLYYWTGADYNAADVLTADNATGMVSMSDAYTASVTGIAPKNLDDTVYVAVVYTTGGQIQCSGVLAYSIGAYCVNKASQATGTTMGELAAATAVYGYYTKLYFGNV